MKIPDIKEFNKNNIREKFIKTHYSDFYNFLCNEYPDISIISFQLNLKKNLLNLLKFQKF